MPHRTIATLVAGAALILAGCSPAASVAPSEGSARIACRETTDPGTVAVRMVDYAFEPDAVRAAVGQVIAFTGAGQEPHAPALDDGACATRELDAGQTDGLVFGRPGAYPFHCSIHPWMVGTIEIG
jgi:plastocyanin